MLLTRDEATVIFTRSACRLALDLDVGLLAVARLLARTGSLARLDPAERHAVADHWAIVDHLVEAGHGDIIESELEGIGSILSDRTVLREFAGDLTEDTACTEPGSLAA